MKFDEPIDRQPIRIIETDHICKDIYDFAFWLELNPDRCLRELKRINGRRIMKIEGWHIEPVYSRSKARPIEILSYTNNEINEYNSVYDASVKLGFQINDIYDAIANRGPLAKDFKIRYINQI